MTEPTAAAGSEASPKAKTAPFGTPDNSRTAAQAAPQPVSIVCTQRPEASFDSMAAPATCVMRIMAKLMTQGVRDGQWRRRLRCPLLPLPPWGTMGMAGG